MPDNEPWRGRGLGRGRGRLLAAAAAGALLVADRAAPAVSSWWELLPGSVRSNGYAVLAAGFPAAGAVYVAASGRDTNWAARLYKFSPYGQLLWNASRSGAGSPDAEDAALGLALHPSGDLIVGGRLWDGPAELFDAWLARYTADGTLKWSLTLAGAAHGTDMIESVACQPTGDIVAVGVRGVGGHASRWLARFDGTGALKSAKVVPAAAGADDAALAVVANASGSIFVAGYQTDPAGWKNAWIAKYDPALSGTLWATVINGPASSTDYVAGLAFAPDGSLVACGGTTVPGRALDAWLLKLAEGTGAVGWSLTLDGGEGDDDAALGVTVDPVSGTIFVTGTLDRGATYTFGDAWTAAFTPAGTLLWQFLEDGVGHFEDLGRGVAATPGGGAVYATGSFFGADNQDHLYVEAFHDAPPAAPAPASPRAGIWASPSPFRPGTGGDQDAPGVTVSGLPAGATVRIYTVRGGLVAELAESGGRALWDGRTSGGKNAASGVYVYVVTAPNGAVTRGKVVVIR